jgi:hypothetical protein
MKVKNELRVVLRNICKKTNTPFIIPFLTTFQLLFLSRYIISLSLNDYNNNEVETALYKTRDLRTKCTRSFKQLRSLLRNKATLVIQHQFSDSLVQFADQLYRFWLRMYRFWLSKQRYVIIITALAIRNYPISLRIKRFCLSLHHNCLTALLFSKRIKRYVQCRNRLCELGNQRILLENQCSLLENQYLLLENQYWLLENQFSLLENQYSLLVNQSFVFVNQWFVVVNRCFILQQECLLIGYFRFLSLLNMLLIDESYKGLNDPPFIGSDFFAHRASAGKGNSICPTYPRQKTMTFKHLCRSCIVLK